MTHFIFAVFAIDSLAVGCMLLMAKFSAVEEPKQSLGWIDADYMPKQFDN